MTDVRSLYAEVSALRREAKELLSGSAPAKRDTAVALDEGIGLLESVATVFAMSVAAVALKHVQTSDSEDLSRECVELARTSIHFARDNLLGA